MKTKKVNYIESDSEGTDGDDVFKPKAAPKPRPSKRRRLVGSDTEDVYEQENEVEQEDGMYYTHFGLATADLQRYRRLP